MMKPGDRMTPAIQLARNPMIAMFAKAGRVEGYFCAIGSSKGESHGINILITTSARGL
jgi:hypothetical protein